MFVDGNPALNDFLDRLCYGAPHALRAALANQLAGTTLARFRSVAGAPANDATAIQRLRSDGVVELGRLLDDRQLADIHAALAPAPVYDAHIANLSAQPTPFAAMRGKVHYASYAAPSVLAAPHLIELANDPRILALAEAYLGCPPTLYSVNAWWSFPQPQKASFSQALHRDRDDLRFVTLFVYLTPVTSLTGPHRYIRFSHDQPALVHRLMARGMAPAEAQATTDALFAGTGYQISDQAEALLGDFVHTWVGEAGSAILADTYGLHMGKPPQQGERLMFWARYGLGTNHASLAIEDVGGGVDLAPRLGGDPRARYVNRVLTGDRAILAELGAAAGSPTR